MVGLTCHLGSATSFASPMQTSNFRPSKSPPDERRVRNHRHIEPEWYSWWKKPCTSWCGLIEKLKPVDYHNNRFRPLLVAFKPSQVAQAFFCRSRHCLDWRPRGHFGCFGARVSCVLFNVLYIFPQTMKSESLPIHMTGFGTYIIMHQLLNNDEHLLFSLLTLLTNQTVK